VVLQGRKGPITLAMTNEFGEFQSSGAQPVLLPGYESVVTSSGFPGTHPLESPHRPRRASNRTGQCEATP
jgi:hypothetical protein